MIKRLKDVAAKIEKIVDYPFQRGKQTGFKCLDRIYSIKVGSYTCFHAAPHHGKSELQFEIMMNLSLKYDDVNVIYSPESGTAEEIMLELAHKYLQKQVARYNPMYEIASDVDRYNALAWVDHHFIILDDEDDEESDGYTWDRITEEVESIEKEYGITVHNIMAEPYNEIIHDMKDFGSRQDMYIEYFLTTIRRYARRKKKHVFLAFHVGKQEKQKIGNHSFYPMPRAREASGGQAALRKAMMWLNMWRPPNGLKDDKGQPYAPNELVIEVEKARPKYFGYRGTCSLFFNMQRSRYFEKINGIDCFAFEHETRKEELAQAEVLIPVSQVEMAFVPNEVEILPF